MNERIRELIKTKSTILFTGTDSVDGEITDIEKFAELIVKECMDVANTYQNRGGNCYVDDMIAKHFGVE